MPLSSSIVQSIRLMIETLSERAMLGCRGTKERESLAPRPAPPVTVVQSFPLSARDSKAVNTASAANIGRPNNKFAALRESHTSN